MLDYAATLDPANGVCHQIVYAAPIGKFPLWTVGVDTRGFGFEHKDAVLQLSGGTGFARLGAIQRAAGEAVERFALLPNGDSTLSGIGLIDGHRSNVIASAVDWPSPLAPRTASPSGAAAGDGREMAVVAGLLELVERDAAMINWHAGWPIQMFDRDQLCASDRAIRRAYQRAEQSLDGGSLSVCILPTDVVGVTVCVALAFHEGEPPVASIGCGASLDWKKAVLGAIRESLQGCAGIRMHSERASDAAVKTAHRCADLQSGPITDDCRVLLFGSDPGRRELTRWRNEAVVVDIPETIDRPTATPSSDLAHLLSSFDDAGLRPVVVDLTYRLPPAIQDLGWSAVKLLCDGLQPLIMDETAGIGFDEDRLQALATHLRRDVPAARRRFPHPWV